MKIRPISIQFISFSSLILIMMQSFSCIPGGYGGPTVSEKRNVGVFKALKVSSGIDLYVTQGDRISVEVETDEKSADDLITEVRGEMLTIYFDRNFMFSKTARVYVTVIELFEIESSGGSDVNVENVIESESLTLKSSGGSDIRLDVNAGVVEIKAGGGSDIVISGKADQLIAETSGGSDLKGYELLVNDAMLSSSGGSDIEVHVVNSLDARATGGSDIRYKGAPQILKIKSSSSADIKPH